MKIENRIQGKKNKKAGIFGEQMAERALLSLGFKCVEPIETGWRIKWINGKVVSAKPKAKVSGDFSAIDPKTGRYVHVEVKTRGSGVLKFSDLEKHQVEAMNAKVKAGALAVLIWVKSPTELKILQWPVKGFEPGTSIKWEQIK